MPRARAVEPSDVGGGVGGLSLPDQRVPWVSPWADKV